MAVAIDYILPWTQLVVTVAGENVFNTNWTADKETDILVYARAQDEEARDVLQILPQSQYSVFFIGDERLVQVVLATGRNVGDIVTITRDTPQDRMNFFSNTNFTPSMLNGEFARLVMMAQQSELYDKDLSPRYNTSETLYDVDRIIDLYLPKLPPNHFWMKNEDNTRIIAVEYSEAHGRAPADATYIVQTSDPELPNAQALDELSPGVMVTDGTGVVRTTDIIAGSGISVTGGTSQADPFVISSDGASIVIVTTPYPHGFAKWEAIRRDGSSNRFVPAQANSRTNAEVVGIVIEVQDAHTFSYQQSGIVRNINDFPGGLIDGECYFLDAFNQGQLTTTEPSVPGLISKPMFLATGPDEGLVLPMRGIVIGDDSGGGSGSSIVVTVNTVNPHGFVKWDIVRRDGVTGQFVLAQADNRENAEAVGIIIEVPNLNTFVYQQAGVIKNINDFPGGLIDGECYFLDAFNAGELTTTEPSVPGLVSKPMFLATGPDEGLVLPMRGIVIGDDSGGGSGSSIVVTVNTVNPHGFVKWDIVRRDGVTGQFVLAQADNRENAEAVGIIIEVPNLNTFVYQQAGVIKNINDFPGGLIDGECYFLDAFNAGELTTTEPSVPGLVSKPMFLATGPDEGLVLPMRGIVVGGSGGGGGSVIVIVTTPTPHGFVKWDIIRRDKATGQFVLAQADSRENAEVVGIVVETPSLNTFTYQQSGIVRNINDFPGGLIDGECYFLDAFNAGDFTATEPMLPGLISKPIFLATGPDEGLVLPMRGIVISGEGPNDSGSNIYYEEQIGHGFQRWDVIRRDKNTQSFVLAQADTRENSEVCGIVTQVISADQFVYQQSGKIDNINDFPGGIVDGECYFLDVTNAGQMNPVETTVENTISRPVFLATGSNKGQIISMRGVVVGEPQP